MKKNILIFGIVLLVLILILILIFIKTESFTSLAPLPDLPIITQEQFAIWQHPNPKGFNGAPFFERSTLKNVAEPIIKPITGYKIPNIEGEFIPENTNILVFQENSTVFQESGTKFHSNDIQRFIGKVIGSLDITNNSFFNKNGTYGNTTNLNNFKITSGNPDIIKAPIVSNKISTVNSNLNDTGYIDYLKTAFINYLNLNNRNSNYISDTSSNGVNTQETIETRIDKSKVFVIPMYLYDAVANYTTIFTVTFKLTVLNLPLVYSNPVYSITLSNLTTNLEVTVPNKLEPAELYKNPFEKSILDTNGYFSIYNSLGLMAPFSTSKTTITKNFNNLQGQKE
jgi:hypothetical protein